MQSTKGLFIAGTDTGVGKTLTSIGLCLTLKADYWKPVQTGETKDSDRANQFLDLKNIHPSIYDFKHPLSPNQAGKLENKVIDLKKIQPPKSHFLITEGIGGILVPFNNKETQLDLILQLGLEVILVARSGLGTLNHTLLSLEVLNSKGVKVRGVVLSGEAFSSNKEDLEKWSGAPIILEIPHLSKIDKASLLRVFKPLKI